MARDVNTIWTSIMNKRREYPALSVLSASMTGIFGLTAFVVAWAINILETLFDAHRLEVNDIKKQAIAGTPTWYIDQAKNLFQYSDILLVDSETNQVYYAVPDESKRIIKYAAIVGNQVKVAKEVSGLPVPLSSEELTAYQSFLSDTQFVGSKLTAVSSDADLLKIQSSCYHNGLRNESDLANLVADAIDNYLQNLDFAGRLYVSKLENAVQAIGDDIDFNITLIEAKNSTGTYANVARVYSSFAGYLSIDPDYPLSSQITYAVE